MVAPIPVYREIGLAGVRVRRGLRGKLVLEVCFHQQVCHTPPRRGHEANWEPAGKSAWRDANGNHPTETALVVAALNKIPFEEKEHGTEIPG